MLFLRAFHPADNPAQHGAKKRRIHVWNAPQFFQEEAMNLLVLLLMKRQCHELYRRTLLRSRT